MNGSQEINYSNTVTPTAILQLLQQSQLKYPDLGIKLQNGSYPFNFLPAIPSVHLHLPASQY